MSKTTVIRTKLTAKEWASIRKRAIDQGRPAIDLVTDVLRKHLLPKEA